MKLQNVADMYGLSPLQHGLLFHTLAAPESGVYFEQVSLAMHGRLRSEEFRQAWQQVTDRHAILRTAFLWQGLPQPLQVVRQQVQVPWVAEDWRGRDAATQAGDWQALLSADRARGFELAKAPLMRLTLNRVADDAWWFLWSHHHLLLDGWSLGLVLKEVLTAYQARVAGKSVTPPPVRPYREYLNWLKRQSPARAETYWRNTLRGYTGPSPLGVERPAAERPAGKSNHREQRATLPADLTAALGRFARQNQLTLSTVVQGAWAVLMARYAGEEDVVIGTTVSGRPAALPGVETMVGLFINSLPVRLRVPAGEPLVHWLQALQAQVAELRQYEHSSLVEVQGWSDVPRGRPLFESLFVFENYPLDASLLGGFAGVQVRNLRILEQADFPLALTTLAGPPPVLRLSYDANRFEDATAARMLGHVQTLLEAMTADPRRALGQLPLLTADERHRQLVEWNRTQADFPADVAAHRIFEARAARAPDAPAVVWRGVAISYRELNRRANRLAHYLRGLGVGPEVLAGIYLDRSDDTLVSILGILKAGGAYLPLDPTYPPERIAFLLSDSRVPVLLTKETLLPRLPAHAARVVCLDRDGATIAAAPDHDPDGGAGPDNLAYVIYTSGSTGNPKGALLQHRGLNNMAKAQTEICDVRPGDRVLQFAPLSFDASVWEMFGAFYAGAALVLASRDDLMPGPGLLRTLREQGITSVTLPPSALAVMSPESLPALRTIVVAGEAVAPDLVARWAPGRRFVNGYGPTEATVCATSALCVPGERVTIGRPLPNVQVYILDAHMQPVPVGVAGELHIGGVGLARGYHNRPELTAAKFVPNPFDPDGGSRLYKSGDLARWLPDGSLEFLGRIDRQVKVRGFRIEAGEVEAALRQHPGVGEAVVVAREDTPGDKRLVAYVVADPQALPAVVALRQFLLQQLPEHMVPSAFVALEHLPLTPNGKIDHRALPSPEDAGRQPASVYAAPRNAIEEVLAGIWADILKVKRVGIHDSFFDLGGHSLMATQVFSRLNQTFQAEVPLSALFEEPTVAGLAAAVRAARDGTTATQPPPIRRAGRDRPLALSFAQQRLWFLDKLVPDPTAYNTGVAVHLHGPLDVDALHKSFRELVRRHEVLRTTLAEDASGAVQVIAPSLDLPLPVVDLTTLPESERLAEAHRLGADDLKRRFDLAHGPMLRLTLLRLAPEEHVLVLTMHLIVTDAWSIGILIHEVAQLYEAYVGGRPSPLPELEIQYADFAEWQRGWLRGDVLDRQLTYWKERLAGLVPLELPTDRPRPALLSHRGAKLPVTLPPALTAKLHRLAREEGVTLYMTLLAAFQALLHRYTGQHDVAVGSPIACRNRPEIEGLIGFFVNTVVMRTDLSDNPTFRELLARVREITLGAYAHQDLPFEQLVEEIKPERDPSRSPLFQVMLVLENAPMPELRLAGLRLTPAELPSDTAKFDLNLNLTETEQGLVGWFEYNRDLFDAATIERLAAHFCTLIESAVADPRRRVGRLKLLPDPERRQIVLEWNDTARDYPADRCMHHLFEEQVRRQPDAVAVVAGDTSLTYAELNARANQLAHHLQALGVGPNVLAGVYLERSADMVVAVLAVLKAGGAYVPIDVAYPQERVAFLLQDTGAGVLLTQECLVANLPRHQVPLVRLDADGPAVARRPTANPAGGATAGDLAYLIYTSGSTGQPKGVMVRHAPAVNLIDWVNRTFHVGPEDRLLFVTSLCFDLSVYDIFGTLAAGASLRVAASCELRDPEQLLRILREEPITFWDSAPAMLQQLVPVSQYLRPAPGAGKLRLMFLSGDWIPVTLPDWARGLFPGVQVISLGGATEAAIWSNYYPIGTVEPHWVSIPYGKPIQNARYHILDAHLNPVPVGVPGELHIGGGCLADGYFNRPELTAERFIADPFNPEPGSRLYKTGDRARYWPDGNIEFLGRIDSQVKIRGFRIELGEIETVLGQHPAVAEAAVLARKDEGTEKYLAAYAVFRPGQDCTVAELRRHLHERLPEYMVPAHFVVLEALPLTANGKVDRRALPAPAKEAAAGSEEYSAPQSPRECLLADVWQQVLGVPQVGIHDNFFELGGDSILSIQVVARANQAGLRLSPRHLFQHQTIAELAGLEVGGEAQAEQGPLTGPVPLTPSQHAFFELEPPGPGHANQALLFELHRELAPALLGKAVGHLQVHHDALRLRFGRQGRQWCQEYASPDLAAPFAQVDLAGLSPEHQAAALAKLAGQAQASLDLAEGPLWRVVLFDLGPGRAGRLLIVVHDLVADGASWRILLEDLLGAYEQLARGLAPQLPPKTTSFRQWATHLEEQAADAALADELDYWLDGARWQVQPLPLDHPEGANTWASVRTVETALAAEETAALLGEAPEAYRASLDELLLTALAQALTRWTGRHRHLVDIAGDGRGDGADGFDLSRTVGSCTRFHPALLEIDGADRAAAAVRAAKEQLRRTPAGGHHYGLLRYLSPEPEPRSKLDLMPQADVLFRCLGQLDGALPAGAPLALVPESPGPTHDGRNPRRHALECTALVRNGCLHVVWTFGDTLNQVTVAALSQTFTEALRGLIDGRRHAGADVIDVSDFPDADLDQDELNRLLGITPGSNA